MCNAPFLANAAACLPRLDGGPSADAHPGPALTLPINTDPWRACFIGGSYISHYAQAFGHCSTCRLFNCHNTCSIAE